MTLLTPLALALSVLSAPIILMYFLKLRRQERRVPSTVLWQRALQDVQANAPWQRLRFNMLLLLQLLALAAIVLALARPAYSESHVITGDLVVLLDQSYDMQAHDVRPSRFAVAQERARTYASELGGGHVMSVIGMGAQPQLAIADSSDPGAVDAAINRLQPGVSAPNLLAALSLAAALARDGQHTRVVILTSRDSGIAHLPLTVNFPVDVVRVGGSLRDVGITYFSASAPSGGSAGAVARVSNFGSSTAHSDLNLLVNGKLADVRPLTLGPHAVQNLVWTDLPTTAQTLQISLTRRDDVSTDKLAYAVIPGPAPRNLLLVSSGDYFLQSALLAAPNINVSQIAPTNYVPTMSAQFDLTIFDGFLPPAPPPGPFLLVNPPAGSIGALRFGKTAAAGALMPVPGLTGWEAAIMHYVDLGDVHLAQLRTVSLPSWMQPIITAAGQPIVAAGEANALRYALISIDLERSDWPLRISFPVLLQNLVSALAPGLDLGATSVSPGGSVHLYTPPHTRKVTVRAPDGKTTTVPPPYAPFTGTTESGIYTVRAVTARGTTGAAFAVNFFPARPAPAGGPAVLHLGKPDRRANRAGTVPISVAWVGALLALVLLSAEWWLAFRGWRR